MKKRYTARLFEDLLQFLLPWSLTLVLVDTFCLNFLEAFSESSKHFQNHGPCWRNNENNL